VLLFITKLLRKNNSSQKNKLNIMSDSERLDILESKVKELEKTIKSLKKFVKTDSLGNIIEI